MIKYKQEIPNFIPYKELLYGTNRFMDLKYLLNISGYIPIIIGKGETQPLVWLYYKNNTIILPFVDANKSVAPFVHVVNNNETKTMSIFIYSDIKNNWVILLSISYNDNIVVKELDLRPIGLNIYIENKNVLYIGTNRFSGNSYQGYGTFINVEE